MLRLLVTLLLLLLSLPLQAAQGTSDPGGLAVGARGLAMGRAMVSEVRDSHAVFVNPANLSYISSSHFSSFFSKLFDEFGYTNFVGGLKVGQSWWGAGLSMVSLDGIPGNIALPYGTQTRIVQTGTYTAADTLLAVSYAQYLGSFFMLEDSYVGITGKYFSQRIDTYSGSLVGGDVGFRFKLSGLGSFPIFGSLLNQSRWGLVAYNPLNFNLDSGVNTLGLETHFRVGVSNEVNMPFINRNITAAVDFDTLDGLHAGAEYWLDPKYAVRAGWDAGRPTLGGGLIVSDFTGFDYNPHTIEFGYAVKFYEEQLGLGHFFSITYLGVSYTETPEILKPSSQQTVATNRIDLQGKAVPGSQVRIYVENEFKALTSTNEAGIWTIQGLSLKRGINVISATAEEQGLVESPRSQTLRVLYKADLKPLNATTKRTKLDVLIFAETPETLAEVVALLPNGEKLTLKYYESDKNWQGYWQLPVEYSTAAFVIKFQGKDADGNLTPVQNVNVDAVNQ